MTARTTSGQPAARPAPHAGMPRGQHFTVARCGEPRGHEAGDLGFGAGLAECFTKRLEAGGQPWAFSGTWNTRI